MKETGFLILRNSLSSRKKETDTDTRQESRIHAATEKSRVTVG